jgi:hypothetical protein
MYHAARVIENRKKRRDLSFFRKNRAPATFVPLLRPTKTFLPPQATPAIFAAWGRLLR